MNLHFYRNPELGIEPQTVSAGGTTLYGWLLINPNLVTIYVKVYDHPDPTVGTTAPIAVIPVPPGDGVNPGIFSRDDFEAYRRCYSALTIAAVAGLADDSTTAPTTPIYCEAVYL